MPIDPSLVRLAQIIKRKCNVLAWREGETLAKGALLSKQDEDEVVLVVPAPHFEVAPNVSLCPGSSEWSCDCGGELDPCSHVAAAIIAVTAERPAASQMPTLAESSASLEYRFEADPKQTSKLLLKRFIKLPDARSVEIESLARAQDALGSATLVTREDDRTIDRLLEDRSFERMDEGSVERLFEHLSRAQVVLFDGEKITVSHQPLAPSAKVTAKERGWRLTIERPEGAIAIFRPGVVRTRAGLAPLRGAALIGTAGERAPIDRTFDARDTAELVAKVLPSLEGTVQWKHRASDLPTLKTGVLPRVSFEVSHGQRALEVRPWIVYGDPPVARVEAGRLLWLGGDVAVRDEPAEVSLGHKLRDELGLIAGRAVTYEGEDAGRFLKSMRAFDERVTGAPSRIDRRKLVPSLRVTDDDVELLFTAEEQGDAARDKAPKRATAESVLRAWESGLDVVALEGGGFAPIPSGWLAKNGALVAQLLAAREGDEKVSAAAAPAVLALCERLESPPPPSFARLRPLVDGLDAIPRSKLPEDLTAELRPYQRAGIDWLCFLRDASLGAVLADDMGLGKTLQCLASLRSKSARALEGDSAMAAMGTLVVCPRSLVHNWAEECARFRPGLKVSIYHGESRELDPSADVTITTYAILRLDEAELAEKRWDSVVLDEAQNIKNPDSRAARASFALDARSRVALSGTPIENKLEELWSIMHFANPGLLGGRSAFDERVSRRVQDGDAAALAELRGRIRPFVLRRRKSAVLTELPPRTDMVVHCELDPHERAVYDAIRAASLSGVVKALREGSDVMQALELLLRLRQASCHSGLVPGQRDPGESSKVTALCEALEEAVGAGHRALVFSQWTSLLDRVEPALATREIAFTRLDGTTRDRAGVVREFQREGGPPVLLASLKAGGTGLNLTAADHVFLLDPWWNPATEEQAADRAHRMGQRSAVTVYRLVAKDTVEERILALQARKRALADAALDEGTLGAALTRDDLLALLE
jgi:superfamily II DNA or RNA helicase